MNIKILITGATGLVGNSLVSKLLNKGYKVNFLTTQKNKINSINGCKGFYWNPFRGEIDLNAFENISHIINLAGAPISESWTKKYKLKLIESRVLSSQILYNSMADLNLKIDGIISASAIGYYPSSINKLYKESDIFSSNNFLQEIVNKWENSINKLEIHSNNIVKLRIGLVLSDKGGFLSKLLTPIKFGLGSSFGSGNQWQSWIHIEDLTHLIIHSIENNLNGVFNAVAPNPISQTELIKHLGERLNRPIFLPNIPEVILKIIIGNRSQLVLGSQKVSSNKILKSGFKFIYEKFEHAILDLKLN